MNIKATKYVIAITLVACSFAMLVTGCSSTQFAQDDEMNVLRAPVLEPGLMLDIHIVVDGEVEIDEDAKRIRAEGDIILPLVGKVHVEGMTLEELMNKLYKLYNDNYLVEPQVEVDFSADRGKDGVSPWGHVTVLGCVKDPGRVNIPATGTLSVSQAIQQAGGFADGAKKSAVRVTRKQRTGKPQSIIVDIHDVGSKGKLDQDVDLRSEDVVFVSESIF